jgi:hypothetical protein
LKEKNCDGNIFCLQVKMLVKDFCPGLLVSQADGGWSRELQGNNPSSHEGIYLLPLMSFNSNLNTWVKNLV